MLTHTSCAKHFTDEIAAAKGVDGKVWCVPSAVSYLLKVDYEEAEDTLRPFLTRRRRSRKLTWVRRDEWQACFEAAIPVVRLFYCWTKDKSHRKKTFAKHWPDLQRGRFVIQTTRHMHLVVNGLIFDNARNSLQPYGLKGIWKCRVNSIWLVG